MSKGHFGWFVHKDHGWMFRGAEDESGLQPVIMSLLSAAKDIEADPKRWERHKLRMHVNVGCNAIMVDGLHPTDHNPDFRPCKTSDVPEHIRKDFAAELARFNTMGDPPDDDDEEDDL